MKQRAIKQEYIILATAIAIAAVFGVVVPNSLSFPNLVLLFKSVSVVAIYAIGMSVVVIGRGIDLSQVSTVAVATAWVVSLISAGVPTPVAIGFGLLFAVLAGVVNGIIVAYFEVPAVIATLSSGLVVLGFGRYFLLERSMVQLPGNAAFISFLGQGYIVGIPVSVVVFLVLLALFGFVARTTVYGRYIYAIGDNPEASRITGLAVRPLIVSQYVLCAVIGYIGGLVVAGSVGTVNLSVANGTMIFDVLTIVIVGGISLVGGRGGALSIVVGMTLIGVLINGLILLNVPSDIQSVVRGAVLLAAVALDSILNPRDEETARQGDL
ncbi:ABC transporter permease [Rhizobium sp. NZLR11]|uniref:ABC transporter permease n=1 Tax=Rhizobium sp. NZLR11 TaxID=2731098 RepID=UPI001C82DC61|nr:ABC transporter permease [Rhizobium sp. NZLR11]MBX5210473.1 ABC transporter permease [Rhizobium sp. NZLR11]